MPDLEQLVRLYLQTLEKALHGDEEWTHNYEWVVIKLYDQAVREQIWRGNVRVPTRDTIPGEDFVCKWSGDAKRIIQGFRNRSLNPSSASLRDEGLLRRIRKGLRRLHSLILRILLGAEGYAALDVVRFRTRGEIHRWMYDRYSLAKLLQQAGFADPKTVGPTESHIPGWSDLHLDTEPDGTVYKPDSLYMEAIKN